MRADCVVVTSPALDDDLNFLQREENIAVEQFVSQANSGLHRSLGMSVLLDAK